VTGVDIRPMEDRDLDAVVSVLDRALGPAPGGVDRRALFEWKHLRNPAGRSVALVAEEGGRLVGVRTLMLWPLRGPGGAMVPAVRAVDTATAPEAQRRGVFSALTRAALERCREDGVALVFNTPNAKSLPGYLGMGWREVTRWPVWLRVRRPLRLGMAAVRRDLRSGSAVEPAGAAGVVLSTASESLARSEIDRLLRSATPTTQGLSTERTPAFLRWRYGEGPVPYHAVGSGDPLRVVVVVRVRARGSLTEAVVCDAIGAVDEAARLLRALSGAVGADHAVAHFGPASPLRPALGAAGYRRLPRAGMPFVVRPVEGSPMPAGPNPTARSSWGLTLGDLELF
jgi:GNAT superfamily N-acetyltransferase